jgi:integrase
VAKVTKNRRKIGVDAAGEAEYRDEGWKVRYVDPDGVEHTHKFKRKAAADTFATEVEHRKLSGLYVDPAAGRVTFKEYAEAWRAAQPHRPGTSEQLESRLRLHVYPAIGARPLAAIRPTELKAMIRGREAQLASSTVENIAGWVASIFNAAVADRIIATSPATKALDVRASASREITLLTPEQMDAVADGLPRRWRAMVAVGSGTGLRQGETLGLQVDRIDFLRRTLKVDQQLVTQTGVGTVLAPRRRRRATG